MDRRLAAEVSANYYAKLAGSLEEAFVKESIRAQCHSKQDNEKNGAEIAALQIQKTWVALSTFKIGRREEGSWATGGSAVNLYIC